MLKEVQLFFMRFIVATMVALAGVELAHAEVLLYDGFATEPDGNNRTPYLSDSDTHKLQSNNAKSDAWTVGLSSSNPWSEGSSVVFTFRNQGLSLPSDFASGGSIHLTQRGGAVGYNSSGMSDEYRCKNRKIISKMPTTGTLYYRCLMKIEGEAMKMLKEKAWRFAGTGLSTIAPVNSYSNQDDLRNNGISFLFFSPESQDKVSLGFRSPSGIRSLITSVKDSTTYICIAKVDYDNKKLSAYAAPVEEYSASFEYMVNDVDASSLTTGFQVMFLAGIYQTNGGRILFDEIAVGTELGDVAVATAALAPTLGEKTLERTSTGEYEITAKLASNFGNVFWIANDGTSAVANLMGFADAEGAIVSGTISDLPADKTYQIYVLAENESGFDCDGVGVIYTGALNLGKTTDANEYGLATGGVMISRASADDFPLVVNYEIATDESGVAAGAAQGKTWNAPSSVTIPAGETTAMMIVEPLMDFMVDEDIKLLVTLTDGNYEMPEVGSALVSLRNLAPPDGYNVWVAESDGNASLDSNWSLGRAPISTDNILFDGRFSTARCIWDASASQTVASIKQDATFTGTVEFQTTYSQGLTISGNAELLSGTWTGAQNSNMETYRIALTIGGDLIIASSAQITATGKGYNSGYPARVTAGTHGGSVLAWSEVYDNYKRPVNLGAGGGSTGFCGGGAIYLAVNGTAVVDGKITAQPTNSDKEGIRFGAGGAIYLSAASIEGSGLIDASGRGSQTGGRSGGGGGRVALYVTGADEMIFPISNLKATGTVGAWKTSGGAGTIFVKTRNQENGTLIIDDVTVTHTEYRQYMHTRHAATPIPSGETWTLDELLFRNSGILVVPEGTTLNVPLSAISSTADRTAGILYEGGTINFTDVPAGGPYLISRKWVFQASVPYTFDGDVTITGGAAIGGMRMSGTFSDFATCDVTVNGNLTIASDGWLFADSAGLACADLTGFKVGEARHGGQMAGSSVNNCYDSVFNPYLPAVNATVSHEKESHGGGVIKLVVNGALTLDGNAVARGPVLYKGAGSGGTISLIAKTLSGNGLISANGEKGSIRWDNGYHGAGGRVAIKVTEQEVGTEGVWANITCQGVSTNALGYVKDISRNTSAGTIYLEGRSDGAKGGTIYVKNNAVQSTSDVYTYLPAAGEGADAPEDFKNASLVVADRANVRIDAERFRLKDVSVEAKSTIDIYGSKLRVKSLVLGGAKIECGTYTAAQLAEAGHSEIIDMSVDAAGTVTVTGGGMKIFVK